MTLPAALTVLSLEQATTLPYMTLRLAEEGARVIRVENPPFGDPNRRVGPEVLRDGAGFEPGMNAYFLPLNLGKESITLDLSRPAGRHVLHRLVRELPVDVFATNQRPRAYEKLGIDYATLRALKPDLIWLGITGFGPDNDEAAYDPILQARSGFMALTGQPDGEPTVFGLPMVDLGAGEHAFSQVVLALYRRAMTGEGSRLDLSMFQSAVSWMVSPVMLSHSFQISPRRLGNDHQYFAPVSVFPTADGHVYLAVGNDRQWQALTRLPGLTALARPEYEHNAGRIAAQERLKQEIAAVTRRIPTAELTRQLQAIGLPVSGVNRLPEVIADPLIAGHMITARDARTGTAIAIPPPPVISAHLRRSQLTLPFPPRLGEHNRAIFGALGLEQDEPVAEGAQ